MNEEITLYIVLRKSLQLDHDQEVYCVAEAVQCILMKYFIRQILTIKARLPTDNSLSLTTQWLSSQTKKTVKSVDDDVWEQIKADFNMGKDFHCLKTPEASSESPEVALVMWPLPNSAVPSYLK